MKQKDGSSIVCDLRLGRIGGCVPSTLFPSPAPSTTSSRQPFSTCISSNSLSSFSSSTSPGTSLKCIPHRPKGDISLTRNFRLEDESSDEDEPGKLIIDLDADIGDSLPTPTSPTVHSPNLIPNSIMTSKVGPRSTSNSSSSGTSSSTGNGTNGSNSSTAISNNNSSNSNNNHHHHNNHHHSSSAGSTHGGSNSHPSTPEPSGLKMKIKRQKVGSKHEIIVSSDSPINEESPSNNKKSSSSSTKSSTPVTIASSASTLSASSSSSSSSSTSSSSSSSSSIHKKEKCSNKNSLPSSDPQSSPPPPPPPPPLLPTPPPPMSKPQSISTSSTSSSSSPPSMTSSTVTSTITPMEPSAPKEPIDPNISAKKDMGTCTSEGTITEPEMMGPCEPGTSVTLEGIVWQETEGGILVVNMTWRDKSYVGTLLDCTKHDWAPPRLEDQEDTESKSGKGGARGKRRGVCDRKNKAGRRTHNSGFSVPPSPIKKTEPPSPTCKKTQNGDLIAEGDLVYKLTSNGLIECPDPKCDKKYKHINGLKYHQTHAHSDVSFSHLMNQTKEPDVEDMDCGANDLAEEESMDTTESQTPTNEEPPVLPLSNGDKISCDEKLSDPDLDSDMIPTNPKVRVPIQPKIHSKKEKPTSPVYSDISDDNDDTNEPESGNRSDGDKIFSSFSFNSFSSSRTPIMGSASSSTSPPTINPSGLIASSTPPNEIAPSVVRPPIEDIPSSSPVVPPLIPQLHPQPIPPTMKEIPDIKPQIDPKYVPNMTHHNKLDDLPPTNVIMKKEPEFKREPESEGVTHTMKTKGPPPAPTTGSYFNYASYMHNPYGHGAIDPGHPMFRAHPMQGPMGHPGAFPFYPELCYPGHHPSPSPSPHPSDSPHNANDFKPPHLNHQKSPYSSSPSHKIHELGGSHSSPQSKSSPSVANNNPHQPLAGHPNSTPSNGASSTSPSTNGMNRESPPPQRHLHTHHHTHVGVPFPPIPFVPPPHATAASRKFI